MRSMITASGSGRLGTVTDIVLKASSRQEGRLDTAFRKHNR
jgi:hypothetical protein